MNKILSKTVKKTTLLSAVIAVIVAAAIVVAAIWGFNKSITMDDGNTLTVSVNTFAFDNDKEELATECEKVFDKAGVSSNYVIEGQMDGDTCELVFVFDKDVDARALTADVKTALTAKFTTASIDVSSATERATAVLAKYFALRVGIAVAAFAVLAFAYVAIRYRNVWTGIAVGVSVLCGMILTAGLIILTRIPVTVTVDSVIAIAGLLTSIGAVLVVGKVRSLKKEGETDNENAVLSAIPVKEMKWLYGGLAVAMLLVGALGGTAAAWYATSAFVALLASAAVVLFYAPALCLAMQKVADKMVKPEYVGAKKKEKSVAVEEEAPEDKTTQD